MIDCHTIIAWNGVSGHGGMIPKSLVLIKSIKLVPHLLELYIRFCLHKNTL